MIRLVVLFCFIFPYLFVILTLASRTRGSREGGNDEEGWKDGRTGKEGSFVILFLFSALGQGVCELQDIPRESRLEL